jgi:hypothetical protein
MRSNVRVPPAPEQLPVGGMAGDLRSYGTGKDFHTVADNGAGTFVAAAFDT